VRHRTSGFAPVLFGGLSVLLSIATAYPAAPPQYRIAHELAIPGDEGWDYLALDADGARLFIAHGSRVEVIDTRRLARIGTIEDTPGVHGIALAPALQRGFISAGRAGFIVEFDLRTLARLRQIPVTGENPDAILYDAASQRVFTFNGRGRNVTAVDAVSGTVLGTIAVDAKPEFAVSDGAGRIYVNLEDRNSLAVLDPHALKVQSVWPLTGCDAPSGLALDSAGERLFAVCDNQLMAVMDARSGAVLAHAPIGAGADAAAYDPHTHLAFASCGAGVLSVIDAGSAAPQVVQTLVTRRGARTMALDPRSHRVYLVTAEFGATPAASPAQPHPRPAIRPGTFRLLVLEREAATASTHEDPSK
jgi:DNA-binding beta-propeller fold protein YncE